MNMTVNFYTRVYKIFCLFGMNHANVFGGISYRKLDSGRLYISRALRMHHDGFCVNDEVLFV